MLPEKSTKGVQREPSPDGRGADDHAVAVKRFGELAEFLEGADEPAADLPKGHFARRLAFKALTRQLQP